MAGKYIFLLLIAVLYFAWQAQCAVNCTSTGAGRFADPDDQTCKNYTTCVFYPGFIFSPPGYISLNYTCASNSLFNPKTGLCTTKYACNSTTNSTNHSSFCNAPGRFPAPNNTNCSDYIECIDINGTYMELNYSCPNTTYFNPNSGYCEYNYKCPSSFKCSSAGRYPNTSDKTCKSYYFCVQLSDGSYIKNEYVCPSISVFSPTLRLCTTSYTCP